VEDQKDHELTSVAGTNGAVFFIMCFPSTTNTSGKAIPQAVTCIASHRKQHSAAQNDQHI
jgi:hypothetical protein